MPADQQRQQQQQQPQQQRQQQQEQQAQPAHAAAAMARQQQQGQQQQQQQLPPQLKPREDAQTVYIRNVRYTKLECVGRGGSSKVFKVGTLLRRLGHNSASCPLLLRVPSSR